MSKAILVIDIPKKYEEKLNKITVVHTCYDDETTRTMLINDKGKKIEDYNMYYLKPLPQYKLTNLDKTTDYSCGWDQGYNSCINEILGEKEW